MPPGAPAGIALLDTMPTTLSFRSIGCVTGFRATPSTCSAPYVALYVSCEPIAPRAERKPSVVASLSLSSTSLAASELGSRPALSVGIPLEDRSGGSETSAPDGGGAGLSAAGAPAGTTVALLNVPLIATCPHDARTCGCAASVASVTLSNAAVRASGGG